VELPGIETAGGFIQLLLVHFVAFFSAVRGWSRVFGVQPQRACVIAASAVLVGSVCAFRSWLTLILTFLLAGWCVGRQARAERGSDHR